MDASIDRWTHRSIDGREVHLVDSLLEVVCSILVASLMLLTRGPRCLLNQREFQRSCTTVLPACLLPNQYQSINHGWMESSHGSMQKSVLGAFRAPLRRKLG
tara:strand:+ start:498 stop:803 length:306 start_codon:yes stop_codon:yes gene_type:complete